MNKSHQIWEAAKAAAEASPGKPSLVLCVEGTFTLTWTPRAELKGTDKTLPATDPVAPREAEQPPTRRIVTTDDLQGVISFCGHRGDSCNLEYLNRMGQRIQFYPKELLALVQAFLDAEQTRALLRGTVEGWKARTRDKGRTE